MNPDSAPAPLEAIARTPAPLEAIARTPKQREAARVLHALGLKTSGRIYEGTVARHVKANRRAKNKAARRARATHRP